MNIEAPSNETKKPSKTKKEEIFCAILGRVKKKIQGEEMSKEEYFEIAKQIKEQHNDLYKKYYKELFDMRGMFFNNEKADNSEKFHVESKNKAQDENIENQNKVMSTEEIEMILHQVIINKGVCNKFAMSVNDAIAEKKYFGKINFEYKDKKMSTVGPIQILLSAIDKNRKNKESHLDEIQENEKLIWKNIDKINESMVGEIEDKIKEAEEYFADGDIKITPQLKELLETLQTNLQKKTLSEEYKQRLASRFMKMPYVASRENRKYQSIPKETDSLIKKIELELEAYVIPEEGQVVLKKNTSNIITPEDNVSIIGGRKFVPLEMEDEEENVLMATSSKKLITPVEVKDNIGKEIKPKKLEKNSEVAKDVIEKVTDGKATEVEENTEEAKVEKKEHPYANKWRGIFDEWRKMSDVPIEYIERVESLIPNFKKGDFETKKGVEILKAIEKDLEKRKKKTERRLIKKKKEKRELKKKKKIEKKEMKKEFKVARELEDNKNIVDISYTGNMNELVDNIVTSLEHENNKKFVVLMHKLVIAIGNNNFNSVPGYVGKLEKLLDTNDIGFNVIENHKQTLIKEIDKKKIKNNDNFKKPKELIAKMSKMLNKNKKVDNDNVILTNRENIKIAYSLVESLKSGKLKNPGVENFQLLRTINSLDTKMMNGELNKSDGMDFVKFLEQNRENKLLMENTRKRIARLYMIHKNFLFAFEGEI